MEIPYEKRACQLPDGNINAASGSLESAESYLAASARAGRACNGSRSPFSASYEALVQWGQENTLIRPESAFDFFRLSPDASGDEHELWFQESSNRWLKATYHNKFGLAWGRDGTATASEYFTRLVLQNKYFGDDVCLIAVVQCGERIRILTSQPHIAGKEAKYEEIRQWFLDLKFKYIEEDGCVAWYHKQENLLVADAHEGNVILTDDGMLVPIDVNLVQPEGDLFAWAND